VFINQTCQEGLIESIPKRADLPVVSPNHDTDLVAIPLGLQFLSKTNKQPNRHGQPGAPRARCIALQRSGVLQVSFECLRNFHVVLPHTQIRRSSLSPFYLPPTAYHLDDVRRHSLVCRFGAGAPSTRSWNAKVVLNVYIWGEEVGVTDPDPVQLLVESRL
jgi:hypothetical protein